MQMPCKCDRIFYSPFTVLLVFSMQAHYGIACGIPTHQNGACH